VTYVTALAQAFLDRGTRTLELAIEDLLEDPAVEARWRAIADRAVEAVEATEGECGGGADGVASKEKRGCPSTRCLSSLYMLPSTMHIYIVVVDTYCMF
jgi:hypothetical protein